MVEKFLRQGRQGSSGPWQQALKTGTIAGAIVNVDVFDTQGRPMMNLRNVSGVVRIKAGSKSMVKRITLK